jgi:hypothetical protein
MVKTPPTKPTKTVKVAQHRRSALSGSVDGVTGDATEDAGSPVASDMDDEEFAECLADHVDHTTFDDRVDKCFIIKEIGAIRKVPCVDRNGVEKQKDVYNVNLITPIGESIQLTAWEQLAFDVCDWFT